jgi:hypothetical protein
MDSMLQTHKSIPPFILELPDELLLEIIDHLPFLPRDRRSELVKLAAVNKCMSNIATDLLHKNLLVNVQNLKLLLDLYVVKPYLADKVTGLDLYDTKLKRGISTKNRVIDSEWAVCQFQKDVRVCPHHPQEHRVRTEAYLGLANRGDLSPIALGELVRDLEEADMTAYIALLLLMVLPNLRRLFLANMASPHDNFRAPGYGFSRLCGHRSTDPPVPGGIYMREILDRVAPNLTTMESPNCSCYHMSSLRSLTHLIVSDTSFLHVKYSVRERRIIFATLPPTLKTLRTGSANRGKTVALLEHLLSLRNEGALPCLQRVEVYMNRMDPAIEDGELYSEYADPGVRSTFIQVTNFVHLLYLEGIRAVVKYGCDSRTVSAQFHAIALAANPGLRQQVWFEDLDVLEVRGLFEHWRPEAEKMWIEKRKRLIEMAREAATHDDDVRYPDYRTTRS